jgi:hypothetical protein
MFSLIFDLKFDSSSIVVVVVFVAVISKFTQFGFLKSCHRHMSNKNIYRIREKEEVVENSQSIYIL